jgi:thiol-disulfide isomerase/thioredoxin
MNPRNNEHKPQTVKTVLCQLTIKALYAIIELYAPYTVFCDEIAPLIEELIQKLRAMMD